MGLYTKCRVQRQNVEIPKTVYDFVLQLITLATNQQPTLILNK